MARDREREKIAKRVLAKYVTDVEFGTYKDRPVMRLRYAKGHKMLIIKTLEWERLVTGKLPHQTYSIVIMGPKEEEVSSREFLTAKMVKLAILETKALDLLKGVEKWA